MSPRTSILFRSYFFNGAFLIPNHFQNSLPLPPSTFHLPLQLPSDPPLRSTLRRKHFPPSAFLHGLLWFSCFPFRSSHLFVFFHSHNPLHSSWFTLFIHNCCWKLFFHFNSDACFSFFFIIIIIFWNWWSDQSCIGIHNLHASFLLICVNFGWKSSILFHRYEFVLYFS